MTTTRKKSWFTREFENLRSGKTRRLYDHMSDNDVKALIAYRHEIARREMASDLTFEEAYQAIKFANECGMAEIVVNAQDIPRLRSTNPDDVVTRRPVWDPARERPRYGR